MKKLYSLEVRGKTKEWSFNIIADPKHVEDWREDGLEINEIVNSVPEWAVTMGLTKPWIFMQDLFNFRFKDLFK